MKKTFKTLAVVAACALASSCATISTPITATTNPLGSKCGEAKSTLYLGGLWSSKGAENGIDNTIWPRPRTFSLRLNVNF